MTLRAFMSMCSIGTLAACGLVAQAQNTPPATSVGMPLYWSVHGPEERNINFSGLPIQRGRSEIFYEQHIGKFPRIWIDRETGRESVENEGIPQKTNWNAHLAKVRRDLDARIPDPNWDGTGILDFETWHPNWEMAWNEPMKEMSRQWVRARFTGLSNAQVEARAHEEFEAAGMDFLLRTLQACKDLRPRATWGFYGYPYAFYPANLQQEFRPLYEAVDAFFPPVYAVNFSVVETQNPGPGQRRVSDYVTRTDRQFALTRSLAPGKPIYPLVWMRYHDMNTTYTGQFLNDLDLANMFRQPWRNGAKAVIFWDVIMDAGDRDEYNAFFSGRGGTGLRTVLNEINPPPAPPTANQPIMPATVVRAANAPPVNKAAKAAPIRVLTAAPTGNR